MKILLCAATEMEIAPTLQWLAAKESRNVNVSVTGVGLLTSTYALTKSVATFNADLILQAGVAGTLDENEKLGNVVAVKTETVGDLGVQEQGFKSLFDLKLLSNNLAPWRDSKLHNENDLLYTCGLPLVDAVTVNEISTVPERITYYRDVLGAQIETMEGAALHYVGLMERLPFVQIRSLSNFIGERDKTKWLMQKAIVRLNQELQRILKNLSK